MQKIRKQLSNEEILLKLSTRCATCEYAPSDVYQKAIKYGASAHDAQQIVDKLIDENFINAERYVRAFVNDKLTFSHWGKLKISAALRLKKIPPSLITSQLDTIPQDQYLDILRNALTAKLKQTNEPDPYKLTRKLLSFAASHGFEPSLAYDITGQILHDMPYIEL